MMKLNKSKVYVLIIIIVLLAIIGSQLLAVTNISRFKSLSECKDKLSEFKGTGFECEPCSHEDNYYIAGVSYPYKLKCVNAESTVIDCTGIKSSVVCKNGDLVRRVCDDSSGSVKFKDYFIESCTYSCYNGASFCNSAPRSSIPDVKPPEVPTPGITISPPSITDSSSNVGLYLVFGLLALLLLLSIIIVVTRRR